MMKKYAHTLFRAWTIVICAAIFFCYQYVLRVSPNIMSDEIMLAFSIDAASFGLVIGFYSWAYSAMQLPLGITFDRLGPRLLIGIACFVCAIACFMFGHATNAVVGSISCFLIGMGSACGFLGCLKLGTLWFEPKDLGKVIGLTMTFGTIGAMLGGVPLRALVDIAGFVHTMEILGLIGCVIGVLIFLFVKNHPRGPQHKDGLKVYENNHPLVDLKKIATTPQAWLIAGYSMLTYAPIIIMGVGWGVGFLERAYDIDEKVAATVISSMFLGASIGSPLFTTLSDYIQQRRMPMFITAGLTLVVYCIIVFYPDLPFYSMYVLFFLAGFFYSAKSISFASICEIMPRNMSGVSIAFVNTAVMGTGIIFHPLIGYLIKLNSSGEVVDGVPIYVEADYRFAFYVIPFILVITTILAMFIKESHPESSIVKQYGHIIDTDVL